MPKDIVFDAKVTAADGQPVSLPSGNFVANAEFMRSGDDLYLTSPDGHTVMIEGYFAQSPAPDITTPDGAHLSPAMVEAFLPPAHAGQYAAADTGVKSDVSPAGKITEAVGEAHIIRADGTRVPADPGTPVFPGDVIETAKDGAVNILFADNTTFAISESARLSVDEFIYNATEQSGSTFFSMLQGVFVYTSGLIGKHDPGSVNIETPVGSIGIRGTVVAGDINPAGEGSTITIVDGAIVLTNGGGTIELNDSFETASMDSYQSAPQNTGQMSTDTFTQSYGAVAGVSGSTFSNLGSYSDGSAPHTESGETAPAVDETAPAEGGTTAPAEQPVEAPADDGAQATDPAIMETAETGTTEEVTAEDPAAETTTTETTMATTDTVLLTTTSDAPLPSGTISFDSSATTFDSGTTSTTSSGTTTTTTASSGGTTTTTSSGTTGTSPPPPTVNFNFSPWYLHGTSTTSDDGVSMFNMGGTNVVGNVRIGNVPFGMTPYIEMTGMFSGNKLIYNSATPVSPFDMTVQSNAPLFHFDAGTGNLVLDDPLGMVAQLNPGGFDFQIVVRDGGPTGAILATHKFTVIFDMAHQALAGTPPSNFFIGDPSGISADTITGTAGNDVIMGREGNDFMIGGGGQDIMSGGNGDDLMIARNNSFYYIDGGSGTDTLRLGTSTDASTLFDFTLGTVNNVKSVERIELAKGSDNLGNDLRLNFADALQMVGNGGTLTIDTVDNSYGGSTLYLNSAGLTRTGTVSNTGNATYTWTNGTSIVNLVVDQGTDTASGQNTEGVFIVEGAGPPPVLNVALFDYSQAYKDTSLAPGGMGLLEQIMAPNSVVATLSEMGAVGTVSYAITGGNAGGVFALNGLNIELANPLAILESANGDGEPDYTLTIRGTDNITGAFDDVTVTINVRNMHATGAADVFGTGAADGSLNIGSAPDTSQFVFGDGGNDVILGKGGSDTLLGGGGDDVIVVGTPGFFYVNGGANTAVSGGGGDVLRLGDSQHTASIYDFTTMAPKVRDIEILELGKSSVFWDSPADTKPFGNDVKLSMQDVFEMTTPDGSGNHTLRVRLESVSIYGGEIIIDNLGQALDNNTGNDSDGVFSIVGGTIGSASVTLSGAYNGSTVTLIIQNPASTDGHGLVTVGTVL